MRSREGQVTEHASASGVDVLNFTRSALFVDLDNDSDQDLVVATSSQLLLFSNDGAGRFDLQDSRTDAAGGFSLAAADYDNDGDVYLYVCVYYGTEQNAGRIPTPVPYVLRRQQ